ncbi:glycosyltransferase [Lyngbya confervoides]|uniref:Glycosyltransferase n=1 Tax=Lyngbya confervoides BDU141951 TaxID=1574623 RepID=A0ABD4T014_9CYAN|nr:glycosyltransferase [Lyngbya confervoides]MCM1981750.1 glycosyltransferase [Lyngbya confervoides BDU141951]
MTSPPLTSNIQTPRRRVLIVSPHFPPTNAPDAQRVRTMLPYLAELGWEAEVLAVDPDHVEHPRDEILAQLLPDGVRVTRTGALPTRYTRKVGLGNLGLRSLPFLQRAGDRLLSQRPVDLVFFSTTIFPVMILGRRWQRKFNVPYVLDFQDPWLGGFYQTQAQGRPPGGRLKYTLDKALAQLLEPRALERVSHLISVSPDYPQRLQQRYPHLTAQDCTVLPFGAPESDYHRLPSLGIGQRIFNPQDGNHHWVYVGRGGADMATALHGLFYALRQERDRHPQDWETLRIHFVGTSYAQGDRAEKTIAPIAEQYGLADMVTEHPHRIPYFEAQQVLIESQGILMIGSDDPRYSASKLYPAILARRPLLAIFPQQSLVVEILRQVKAGQVVIFDPGMKPAQLYPHMAPQLRSLRQQHHPPSTDWSAFAPYSAQAMTQKLCACFDRVVDSSHSQPPACTPLPRPRGSQFSRPVGHA